MNMAAAGPISFDTGQSTFEIPFRPTPQNQSGLCPGVPLVGDVQNNFCKEFGNS